MDIKNTGKAPELSGAAQKSTGGNAFPLRQQSLILLTKLLSQSELLDKIKSIASEEDLRNFCRNTIEKNQVSSARDALLSVYLRNAVKDAKIANRPLQPFGITPLIPDDHLENVGLSDHSGMKKLLEQSVTSVSDPFFLLAYDFPSELGGFGLSKLRMSDSNLCARSVIALSSLFGFDSEPAKAQKALVAFVDLFGSDLINKLISIDKSSDFEPRASLPLSTRGFTEGFEYLDRDRIKISYDTVATWRNILMETVGLDSARKLLGDQPRSMMIFLEKSLEVDSKQFISDFKNLVRIFGEDAVDEACAKDILKVSVAISILREHDPAKIDLAKSSDDFSKLLASKNKVEAILEMAGIDVEHFIATVIKPA